MPRTCTVCRHRERATIDGALVCGTPRRELARRFGLSATAVRRHAGGHLPKLLARAADVERTADAGRLLDRVSGLVADLEDMAASAKANADREGFLRVVRELRGALELLGKVTGEIQASNSVTVLLGVWQRLGARDEEEARRAVQAYRDASALDRAGTLELACQFLEREGWTCLRP